MQCVDGVGCGERGGVVCSAGVRREVMCLVPLSNVLFSSMLAAQDTHCSAR